jgi:hypothetical protein
MPTLSDEEQELIQKDRDANPGCFYSTALSQSCRSMNGDSKCEIVKKIFRQCPNARKELISNRKEVTEDEHGGEAAAGEFFNRERMDPRKEYVVGARRFHIKCLDLTRPFCLADAGANRNLAPFSSNGTCLLCIMRRRWSVEGWATDFCVLGMQRRRL